MNRCTRTPGHVVYVGHSADGTAIYVGQTRDWTQRLATHRSKSPWMADVAYFVTEPCADERSARWLEGVLIRQLNPRENVQGKNASLLTFRESFQAEAS